MDPDVAAKGECLDQLSAKPGLCSVCCTGLIVQFKPHAGVIFALTSGNSDAFRPFERRKNVAILPHILSKYRVLPLPFSQIRADFLIKSNIQQL